MSRRTVVVPDRARWPGGASGSYGSSRSSGGERPGRPVLLAVAHGSTDPAAARTIVRLTDRVRDLAPEIDVRPVFIQHGEPALRTATAGLAGSGADVVIIPLLLAGGFHLDTDIASAVEATSAGVAAPLGPDELLTDALAGRLGEALAGRRARGTAPGRSLRVPSRPGRMAAHGIAVVLAAAGSSDPAAAASVSRQARSLMARLGIPVETAFAAAGSPAVPDAVAAARARYGVPVAVASYLLAPGLFQCRLEASGADFVTAPLGDDPALARLILRRYRDVAPSYL